MFFFKLNVHLTQFLNILSSLSKTGKTYRETPNKCELRRRHLSNHMVFVVVIKQLALPVG